jgi:hypothetical protein
MKVRDTFGILLAAAVAVSSAAVSSRAFAFGPLGHRVAGMLAERELCPAARSEVATLGGGESLAELGLWADTIRGQPEWQRSAPWHYMNVDDLTPGATLADARAAIDTFRHPREGDVLAAIEQFGATLADRGQPRSERADALRFVVHFIVDVHQPLHVGRVADRGGNDVDVRVGAQIGSLHRFWDSDVLERRHLGAASYAQRLEAAFAATSAARAHDPPAVWAAESLALRPTVYGFESAARPAPLDDAYLRGAQVVTEQRLVLAAARLAATLNGMFCRAAAH